IACQPDCAPLLRGLVSQRVETAEFQQRPCRLNAVEPSSNLRRQEEARRDHGQNGRRSVADRIANSLIRDTSFEQQHRKPNSPGRGARMTGDVEKLTNKALLQWKFSGRPARFPCTFTPARGLEPCGS